MKVVAKNLGKTYGSETRKVEVLKGLNFTAHVGESVAILGPSGSGKTTFLSLMAGLDTPSFGEIRFGDQIISTMSKR